MKRRKKGREKSILREWVETIIMVVFLVLITRTFVVQAFRIPTGSMENTLLVGDFLLVNKFIYRFTEPKGGDILVFKYPINPNTDYIKRCVATEGQTVQIIDKVLYVDGKPFPDRTYIKHVDQRVLPAELSARDNFGPVTVPAGQLFVMGDNRDNSKDSRFWGFLNEDLVKGKAMIIYFSWKQDPGAPRRTGPLSLVPLFFYNLTHFPSRIRWERIGDLIK